MTTINRIGYQSDYGIAEGGVNPPGSPEARAAIERVKIQLRGKRAPVRSDLAKWLDEQMVARGLTSPVLAAALKTSDSNVRRWRTGAKTPTSGNVAALALYFGVAASEIPGTWETRAA